MSNFKATWKQLKHTINIEHVPADFAADEWNVEQWLNWVYTHKHYSQFLQNPQHAEIIIRGDGLPVGGRKACFLIATLKNYDLLSKCVAFNFVINLAEVNNTPAFAVILINVAGE